MKTLILILNMCGINESYIMMILRILRRIHYTDNIIMMAMRVFMTTLFDDVKSINECFI